MEFEKVRSAVRAAEIEVVRRFPLWKEDGVIRALSEELVFGPGLVISGLDVIGKRLFWACLTAAVFLLTLWGIEREVTAAKIGATLVLGVGISYFGLPTRTVLAGVSARTVNSLAGVIRPLADSPEELDRLSSGVQLVKVQAMDRIARFNVFAGVVWAALFWFVGARILSPTVSPEMLQISITPAFFGGVLFLMFFAAAVSYATAVRVVFQTLDFALIELKVRLATVDSGAAEPRRLSTDGGDQGVPQLGG